MKLLGVETIDVRGLANGVYSFARGPAEAHDRVLVTGGSGAGKTRLLEVVVAARELLAIHEQLPEHATLIRPGNRTSKTILSWLLTAEEQAMIAAGPAVTSEVIFGATQPEEVDSRIGFLLERYAHDDSIPKVEYFSEQRRLDFGGGDATLEAYAHVQLRATMAPTPRKFAWLPTFVDQLTEAPDQAARFASSLERFSPSASYDTKRHVLTSRGRVLKSLRELSASEADAAMISATAALVGLSGSVVLIDRPELHGIDPARALAGLAGLGTDNQLIMATASPAFAAGFDGGIIALGDE